MPSLYDRHSIPYRAIAFSLTALMTFQSANPVAIATTLNEAQEEKQQQETAEQPVVEQPAAEETAQPAPAEPAAVETPEPAPVEYTVTFEAEGSEDHKEKVASGKKVSKPGDPVRDGWVFKGWYLVDANNNINTAGDAFNFDTAIDKDTTLRAWFEEQVTEPQEPATTEPADNTSENPSDSAAPTTPAEPEIPQVTEPETPEVTKPEGTPSTGADDAANVGDTKPAEGSGESDAKGEPAADEGMKDQGVDDTQVQEESRKSLFADASSVPEVTTSLDSGLRPYALVPEDDAQTYYRTYVFQNDEGDVLSRQIVANGQALIQPATPTKQNCKFARWTTENGTLFTGFGQTVEGLTKDETVVLKAVFNEAQYLYFMSIEDNGSRSVVNTTVFTADEMAAGSVLAYDGYEPVGRKVTAWQDGDGKSYPVGSAIADVANGTVLYPETVSCSWVRFDTQGGSSVASQSVTDGGSVDVDSFTSERNHYTFKGWATDPDGSNMVSGTFTPTGDTTLYAVWEGEPVSYTVVYWGENADDNDYSVLATGQMEASASSQITLDATTGALPKGTADAEHFTFKTSSTATIAENGSSVVNVYYSRITYTLKFVQGSGWYSKTLFNAEMKYDADLSSVWAHPEIKTQTDQGYTFTSSITGKFYAYLAKMPGQDLTMTLRTSRDSSKTWYYYVETMDGSAATAPAGAATVIHDGVCYYQYRQSSARGVSSLTYEEDYFPITGFYQKNLVSVGTKFSSWEPGRRSPSLLKE